MIGRFQIKVCGITRAADATVALALGADYLGVNCWSGSPRFVAIANRAQLLREIPSEKRVAITVNPTLEEATGLVAEGFTIIQAHFDPSKAECDPVALSTHLGKAHLWLAPKVATGANWPIQLVPLTDAFVHDAHAREAFGGTGKTSDWERCHALAQKYPQTQWILAGGLGPANITAAVTSGALFFDLNSGVELAPGLKSVEKLADVSELLLKISQS